MSEANLHEMLTFTHRQFANQWIDVRVGAKTHLLVESDYCQKSLD